MEEVCTHVASLLFWTEISIKIRESSTVTDRAAYWIAPSNPSHVQPQKIQDIDFRAPKRKKLEILHCIQEYQQLDKSKEKKENNVKEKLVSKPTQNELHEYFSKLNQSENKPGILRVVPGYANNFRPKSLDLSEQMLTNLYDTANTTLPRDKLLELSQETYAKLKISREEAEKLKKKHMTSTTAQNGFSCVQVELLHQS